MLELPDANLFIDGVVCGASNGHSYPVRSPWTGEIVGQAADASPGDVREAIGAARRAFDETDWSRDHDLRLATVQRYRDIFAANRDRLVDLAIHEAGAARGAVERAHVQAALDGWDDYLRLFPRLEWETDYGARHAFGFDHHRRAVYEPVGVVAAITPWNVPLFINIGKVVAALLAGCTVVLKPAPDTPGMGAVFGEFAEQAGFPAGVINVVLSEDPALAGEILTRDPRVDLVSFTGSTAVGRRIMENGAATLKRVFLELGGKSARIILDDAPDFARDVAQSMLIFHAGQGCAVTSRLLVPRSRYEEAKAILRQAYSGLEGRWGNPDDPAHVMGPVISARQLDRILGYIEVGKREGATLLCGGKARPDMGRGHFIEPTCFVDVTNDMRIAREEIFGPVLVVIPFDDDDDAIRIANDSPYGLSGSIVSGDVERAMGAARRIRTGSISINGGMCIAGDLPFGGRKASGLGREWGLEGIREFLETKIIAEPATA